MHRIRLSPYHKIFYNEWKINPDSSNYNIVFDQSLSGNLDTVQLQNALFRFISDHLILNSHVTTINDELYWTMNSNPRELEYSANNSLEEIQVYVKKPFDLETEPLYRFAIFGSNNSNYRFILVFHHILIDGLSFDSLITEISNYYNNSTHKISIGIDGQRKIITKSIEELYQELKLHSHKNKLFWAKKLSNIEPIDLRFIRKSASVDNNQGESQIKELRFCFEQDILYKLSQLRNQYNISSYRYGQIIFALLIRHYTSQNKFAISYPIAVKEHYGLIGGAKTNTNIVPYNISNTTRILDLIITSTTFMRDVTSSNYRHEYYPIYDIITSTNRSNLDVAFAQTNLKTTKFSFNNTTAEINHEFDIDLPTKLMFERKSKDQKLNYCIKYDANEIDENILYNFVNHYKKLFIDVLDDLGNGISNKLALKYRVVNATEYKQIIYDWNDTQKPYPENKTIHQLFEEQVIKTPDNIAVIYENTKLTYNELNQRSNQLAYYLRDTCKIKGDNLIALCLNRNEYMVIAILAVLKSGAAYVPIDSNYSTGRIHYILEDTRAKIILTNEVNVDVLVNTIPINLRIKEQASNIHAIDDVKFITKLKKYSSKNLTQNITSQNLAYVIFTSGTTGRPKGVMVDHRNVVNFISDHNISAKPKPYLNALFTAPYTFDVSIFDIWSNLLYGHSLFIITDDILVDVKKFKSFLENNLINKLYLPSALLKVHLDSLLALKHKILYFLTGTEPIENQILSQIKHKFPKLNLVNGYGPTEATVCATIYSTDNIENLRSKYIPIGKPVSNVQTYILDNNLYPLPLGAIGELYIGGIGIARGYLNQPELTKERFINNPFQTKEEKLHHKNAILYRTGDLVRYLTDGNIEYIGRNDFQIKINGFRIELGEIESALNNYTTDIKQSVVVAKDHKNNNGNIQNKYLIGYYVAKNKLNEEAVLTYLRNTLPGYMVPTRLLWLEKLPLTISGKLDRNALPEVLLTHDHDDYVAPRNEMETKVCDIYAEVLGLSSSKISITDDFFKLGGNSILAIKLATRLSDALKINISIKILLKHKTIANILNQLITDDVEIIPPIAISNDSRYPLSFAQERLWFIEKYENGNNAYNIPLVMQINPNVDLDILAQSIKSIVSRHEVLHSLIKTDIAGNGCQEICDLEKKAFVINKYQIKTKKELTNYIHQESNHIYKLDKEYPIRVSIINETIIKKNSIVALSKRMAATSTASKNYLIIVIHHISFDGWSVDVLLTELQKYYAYYYEQSLGTKGISLNIPELSIQYKDFAVWQKKYLDGDILKSQLQYWLNKLSGYETLSLPLDNPRQQQIDYAGNDVTFIIEEPISNKLRKLAKNLNVSLYSVLLSSYYILLSSYSNQDDIVLGVPVANRHHAQLEHLIGFFVNNLVLRSKIDKNSQLTDYINNIGTELINAQLNQDLPFEKLVTELNVVKDPSRHPIFQVMFGVQSFGDLKIDKNKLFEFVENSGEYTVAKFDLTTMINDSGIELSGIFNYATSLFDIDTIQSMIKTYQYVLEQVAELSINSQVKIKDIHYLNKEDYKKVIYTWNQTNKKYPENKTIHQLFEEQVIKTPDNIAVVYEDTKLTYRELNEQANRLARYIRKTYKIQGDDLITLFLHRSEYMLVTILATLKAGAAYVPIDPSYPNERIRYILEDTQSKVILANNVFKNKLLDIIQPQIGITNKACDIYIIDDSEFITKLKKYSSKNLTQNITSQNLAYVIYTSGTTGKPKGVMLEHRGIVNRIIWMNNKYHLSKNDIILQKTPYVFDVSVWELFGAIWYGATIIVAKPDGHKDPIYLINLIHQNKVSVMHAVPSMLGNFIQLLSTLKHNTCGIKSLRYIFCSGEALNIKHIKDCYKFIPNVAIHNLYGPTEASIDVLASKCDSKDKRVYIGKPISNIKVYVLGNNLIPLPIGAVGELYISGIGLSRGYLNQRNLTNEKFILNPYSNSNPQGQNNIAKLYKTGDLVRYTSDGNIEYIGRNDAQVKIRGFRIELGEIESTLNNCSGIRQSIVLVKNLAAQNIIAQSSNYLIAYYVAKEKLDEEIILEYLSKKLPEYMMPNTLCWVDKIPLTINGKLDINALPEVSLTRNTDNYVPPRNELEVKVCTIFAEVLGLSHNKIGIYDDFFKLGGDSILAIRLISKINQTLNNHIAVRDIFTHKNISAICTLINMPDSKIHSPYSETYTRFSLANMELA